MPKSPHLFSSILIIPLLVLPIIYVLGVLLPVGLNELCTQAFGDCSTFFTVLGVVLLISIMGPPPPNKRKLDFFKRAIRSFLRKFSKPKQTNEITLKENVVIFPETEHLTTNNILELKNENEILRLTRAKKTTHVSLFTLISQSALKQGLNNFNSGLTLLHKLNDFFLEFIWGDFKISGGGKGNSQTNSIFKIDSFSTFNNIFIRGNYIG
ncbi:MAG: hypothetical protein HWN65_03940 [Candidatus Helarchaeota archaeon]|nr:hypothetical protein [Candidatus Helarchaeota archaeon]